MNKEIMEYMSNWIKPKYRGTYPREKCEFIGVKKFTGAKEWTLT